MTVKIAISLPDELVESARRAVAENRAASVSAYIADAMERQAREDSLSALLDEMDRELGPPSAAVVEQVERQLGLR
jgi:antitoxin ParD1/3/4